MKVPWHIQPSPHRPIEISGGRHSRLPGNLLVFVAAVYASGCSVIAPVPDGIPSPEPPPAHAPPEPVLTTERESDSAREAAPVQAPAPQSKPSAPIPVLVLKSSDSAGSQQVADMLERLLDPGYALRQADISDLGSPDGIRRDDTGQWAAAIAIGAAAAEFAADELHTPTVFCQIFDYEALLSRSTTMFGVEALPPLDLQLRSWKQIAGGADSLGTIVAAEDIPLAAAATAAAEANDIELHVEFAATDQEVLYRFKRFAPNIDGFWLLPSSEILSPRVLRELLEYAADHEVQSIVFNESLLEWGALVSVGSDPADVARTVVAVLSTILNGSAAELSRVTPLTSVNVQINEQAAVDLGLNTALFTRSYNRTVEGNAR